MRTAVKSRRATSDISAQEPKLRNSVLRVSRRILQFFFPAAKLAALVLLQRLSFSHHVGIRREITSKGASAAASVKKKTNLTIYKINDITMLRRHTRYPSVLQIVSSKNGGF